MRLQETHFTQTFKYLRALRIPVTLSLLTESCRANSRLVVQAIVMQPLTKYKNLVNQWLHNKAIVYFLKDPGSNQDDFTILEDPVYYYHC